MEEQKVLFVDDEQNILSSIKRQLRKQGYEILLANSGAEGIEILRNNSVQVIVSDLRMPEMNGVEFLNQANEISAESIKMVLSGYADIEMIMDAINKGKIWRYIAKPWEEDDLKMSVKTALDMYVAESEKKRLMDELKNMNKRLESAVRERTWELQSKSELLNMLLENDDPTPVLKKCCEILSSITGTEDVYIYSLHPKAVFTNTDKKPDNKFELLAEKSIANKKNLQSGDHSALVLTKHDHTLGAVLFRADKLDALREEAAKVNHFLSIIALAVSQNKAVEDAPKLLENIDEIMEME